LLGHRFVLRALEPASSPAARFCSSSVWWCLCFFRLGDCRMCWESADGRNGGQGDAGAPLVGLVLLLAKGWDHLCSCVSLLFRVGDEGAGGGFPFRSLDLFLVTADRWISSIVSLLLCPCQLVLRSGSWGGGWFSSIEEEGGRGVKLMWPTADVLSTSISCSLTILGVRQSIWIGQMGGCKIRRVDRRSQRQRRRSDRRRFHFQHCDDDGRCAPYVGCLAAEIAGGLVGCWCCSVRQDPRTVDSNLLFSRVLYAFSYLWRSVVDFLVIPSSSRVPDVRVSVF